MQLINERKWFQIHTADTRTNNILDWPTCYEQMQKKTHAFLPYPPSPSPRPVILAQ